MQQLTPEELAKRAGALGQTPGTLYVSERGVASTTPPPASAAPQPQVRAGDAGARAAGFERATAERMAAERAARRTAMQSGGIGALDDAVRAQESPAFRRTPDAPGGQPTPATTPRAAAPAAP
ncbi:MAG: hypothetical protein ACRC2H_05650, partial [Silanimonas sp.]